MKWILFLILGVNGLFGINGPYNYDPFKTYIPASPQDSKVRQIESTTIAFPVVTGVLDGRIFSRGKWYEVGEELGSFQLYHIGSRTITFKYQDKIIAVPIGQGGRIVQMKEKE